MLPNSRLFRNRWVALIWAAGIVWFAIGVAGAGKGPLLGDDGPQGADAKNAMNALELVN